MSAGVPVMVSRCVELFVGELVNEVQHEADRQAKQQQKGATMSKAKKVMITPAQMSVASTANNAWVRYRLIAKTVFADEVRCTFVSLSKRVIQSTPQYDFLVDTVSAVPDEDPAYLRPDGDSIAPATTKSTAATKKPPPTATKSNAATKPTQAATKKRKPREDDSESEAEEDEDDADESEVEQSGSTHATAASAVPSAVPAVSSDGF
jgi:hypothetical protein